MRRSLQSLLIPVPEAEALVDGFRAAGDWSREVGVPAHITLAGPFPLSEELPLGPLRGIAHRARGTSFELIEVGRVGEATCLLPADEAPLGSLRRDILEALGRPPDDDHTFRFHLTVSRNDTGASTAALKTVLAPSLPLRCEVKEILVSRLIDDRLDLVSLT